MLPLIILAALSSSVPTLNMESVCRGRGTADQIKNDTKQCMDLQASTKEKLEKEWSSYPAKARDGCARAIRNAPESTYVELLTCIDIQIPDPNMNFKAP
jgi:hypothetical protein